MKEFDKLYLTILNEMPMSSRQSKLKWKLDKGESLTPIEQKEYDAHVSKQKAAGKEALAKIDAEKKSRSPEQSKKDADAQAKYRQGSLWQKWNDEAKDKKLAANPQWDWNEIKQRMERELQFWRGFGGITGKGRSLQDLSDRYGNNEYDDDDDYNFGFGDDKKNSGMRKGPLRPGINPKSPHPGKTWHFAEYDNMNQGYPEYTIWNVRAPSGLFKLVTPKNDVSNILNAHYMGNGWVPIKEVQVDLEHLNELNRKKNMFINRAVELSVVWDEKAKKAVEDVQKEEY